MRRRRGEKPWGSADRITWTWFLLTRRKCRTGWKQRLKMSPPICGSAYVTPVSWDSGTGWAERWYATKTGLRVTELERKIAVLWREPERCWLGVRSGLVCHRLTNSPSSVAPTSSGGQRDVHLPPLTNPSHRNQTNPCSFIHYRLQELQQETLLSQHPFTSFFCGTTIYLGISEY